MIIKSMARKAPTFAQLVAYIGRDADSAPRFETFIERLIVAMDNIRTIRPLRFFGSNSFRISRTDWFQPSRS